MEEKEKKSERKSVPDKGLKRNKTTANFNRSKLAKDGDDKSRKSVGSKKPDADKKAKANLSKTIKTEGNEKKDNLQKSNKKDLKSKTLTKSQTLSTLTSKRKPRFSPKKDDKKKRR